MWVKLMKKVVRQIDNRNRITLPPEILKQLGLESGDFVILKNTDGNIQIVKAKVVEG